MPPSLTYQEATDEPLEAIPVLVWWVRGTLVGMACGVVLVFVIAASLNPYTDDGSARTMETHRQMGLPPCTFKSMAGLPCPSCGMTTSFALLIRGDVWNSLRANCAGTVLGVTCLLFVPWTIVSVWLGRPLFIVSMELAVMRIVIGFLILMLARWAIVLLWIWIQGGPSS